MRQGLSIAAVGSALCAAFLLFPPLDEASRCIGLAMFALGQLAIAAGAILMIRAQLAPLPPQEEE